MTYHATSLAPSPAPGRVWEPSEPYRVLMVAPTPFFADRGCHVRIYEEARSLQALGHRVVIVTYHAGRDPEGLTVERAPRLGWYDPRTLGPSYHKPYLDGLLLAKCLAVARRFRPHLIHAHLHEGIGVGSVLRRIFGVPLVGDLQGSLTGELLDHGFFPAGGFRERLSRGLERWLLGQVDLVISSSTPFTDQLRTQWGISEERLHTLMDGVDTTRFAPQDNTEGLRRSLGLHGKRVVVFVGVLTAYQGVDCLLEAIPRVAAQVPDVHFLLMGYPNVERYRALAQALGAAPWVTFTGRVDYGELPEHLAVGEVAVTAKLSATEANGKILNYMACGLPVVAFDTPVNRELLGPLGVYATPVGDPGAFAEALVGLLRDRPRALALGQALRARVQQAFDCSSLVRPLLAGYHWVLQGWSGRG